MNELTSNEVPQKFADWLLAMGCHPEIVPSVEKVAEKCRGQYYMVWRNLMEKVEPRDLIKYKRPQVFCDDIRRCQKNNVLNKRDTNTVVPEELLLWHRHTQLKEKVADAEARISKEKEENLHQLEEKANSKLCQRYLLRKRLEDSQRKALMLQRLADRLKNEKTNLLETKTIAESLCGLHEETDVKGTLDKCLVSLSRQSGTGSKLGVSLASVANPAASSTAASTGSENNDEEVLSSLARCRGDLLFKQLLERRAGLCAAIPTDHPSPTHATANNKGVRSVVCHTASLLCSLALEATKNRIHVDRTRDKLAQTFLKLDSYLTSEACELLVTRCEVACSKARAASLRGSVDELAARGDALVAERPRDTAASPTSIQAVDKAIESKRDELKRLIASVAAVERKTQNVRERLLARFDSFHDDAQDRDRLGGSSLAPESVTALRQFYSERRERRRNEVNLSMNLDISDNCSFNGLPDNRSPTFVDELKLFLNKFCVERNRKIVLESGEQIWVFESTGSSLREVLARWQGEDASTLLLHPAVSIKRNLSRLLEDVQWKEQLETLVREIDCGARSRREIDISQSLEEEQKVLDRVKKRLNDNIVSLQKTSKALDVGMENLQLWSDNNIRKHISDRRRVDGKTYMQFERAYLNS